MVEGLTLYQAPLRSVDDSLCMRRISAESSGSRSILCAGDSVPAAQPVSHPRPVPDASKCRRGAWPGAYWGSAARDGAAVARRAHNPNVGGSNPSPATRYEDKAVPRGAALLCLMLRRCVLRRCAPFPIGVASPDRRRASQSRTGPTVLRRACEIRKSSMDAPQPLPQARHPGDNASLGG